MREEEDEYRGMSAYEAELLELIDAGVKKGSAPQQKIFDEDTQTFTPGCWRTLPTQSTE